MHDMVRSCTRDDLAAFCANETPLHEMEVANKHAKSRKVFCVHVHTSRPTAKYLKTEGGVATPAVTPNARAVTVVLRCSEIGEL